MSFCEILIFFNIQFIPKVFSVLYVPIYSLSLLVFESVRIKSLAVKHLETSAVKNLSKMYSVRELAH